MADPAPQGSASYVSTVKDCLGVAREALLVAAFLLLLLLPERFNDLLERAGFTKGSVLGFDWEKRIKVSAEQAKGAGDAISQAQSRLKEFDDRLRALDKQTTDASVRSAIALLSRDVQASLEETARADRAARSSVLSQQQLISQVAPGAVESTGWMYLGKTDAPGGKWLAGSPETIETVPTSAIKPGTRLRARDDVYLRADAAPGQPHNEGRVLSVVSRGQEVEVLDIQYPSRPWGAAAWAKVKR